MFISLLKKEVLERKSILKMGAVLILLPFLARWAMQLSGKLDPKTVELFSAAFAWFSFALLGTLFPMIVAVSTVAGEVEKKNISFLLSLPVSRKLIWGAKCIAIMVIVYAAFGLFVLINPVVTDLKSFNAGLLGFSRISWFWVVVALPLLVTAVALFTSSLLDKQMSAALAGVIVLVCTCLATGSVVKMLLWDMSSLETILVIVLEALVYLYASFMIFIRGEQLDHFFPKAGIALRSALTAGTPAVAILLLVFLSATNPGLSQVRRLSVVDTLYDHSGIVTTVSFNNTNDERTWIMASDGRVLRKLPLRYSVAQSLSPDHRLAVITQMINRPGLWATILHFEEQMSRYLVNLETMKITPLAGRYRGRPLWLENNRFAIVTWHTADSGGASIMGVDLFNTEGNFQKSLNVPGLAKSSYKNSTSQCFGENMCMGYGFNSTDEDPLAGRVIALNKIDLASNKTEKIFEKSITNPGEKLLIPPKPISRDCSKTMYFKKDNAGQWHVVTRSLTDNLEKVFPLKGEPVTGYWLNYKNYFVVVVHPISGYTVAQHFENRIMDGDTGTMLLKENSQAWISFTLNRNRKEIAYAVTHQCPENSLYHLTEDGDTKKKVYVYRVDDTPVAYDMVFFDLENMVQKRYDMGTMRRCFGDVHLFDDDNYIVSLSTGVYKVNRNGEKTLVFQAAK